MKSKTICTFDVFDCDEDYAFLQVQAMTKEGTFLKIYEVDLVDHFKRCDLYSRILKIVISK